MTEFYSDMAATASALLAEFGAPVTLRRKVSTFDKVAGKESAVTTSDLVSVGVIRSYKSTLVDGTRIQAGDQELVLDSSQAPQLSDSVKVGSECWNIVAPIVTVAPAGTALIYRVQIRK